MTNDELIYNLNKIKKDYFKYKKELIKKYHELSNVTTNEYLNTHSKYKEGDLIMVNKNDQNNIYKVLKIKTSFYYLLNNIDYFDYYLESENIKEKNLYIVYTCQKIQKSGIIGKSYYEIYHEHNNHIKIGESKDYNTPSKIKKLFEMEFNLETIK
jgi:hypothetical protein